ncbi:hypothetical protein B8W70_15535 [Pseudomonas sp. 1239]|nr:hypothetical protein B8W70_15535 [Pseudomonas sp. 1239]
MVSVPRDEVERLVKLLKYQAHPYPSPHAEFWQGLLDAPAAQHKGDPDRALKDALFACLAAGGGDREYGGVATAGDRQGWVRFTTVAAGAQHQGEPVAFYREFVDGREYCEKPFTNDWTPLYTHAEPGEVERLRAELESVKSSRDAFAQNAIDLRAQLAERDALLRDINKRHSSGVDFDLPADLAARVTALSASAEPSAPKCEDCSGTGSPGGRMHANGIDAPEYEPYKCEKCDGFGIVGNILNAETCTDCTPSAPVDRDELVPAALMLRQAGFGNLADAVDEARAALERKP